MKITHKTRQNLENARTLTLKRLMRDAVNKETRQLAYGLLLERGRLRRAS